MTPTLKQQLEQWIKQSSDNYELQLNEKLKRSGGDSALIEYAAEDFKAGAHSILPMLLVAIECVDFYASGKQERLVCEKIKALQALNKIKSMMEGNGNGNLQKVQQNTEC